MNLDVEILGTRSDQHVAAEASELARLVHLKSRGFEPFLDDRLPGSARAKLPVAYDAERWPEALRCFQVCSDIYAQIGERAKEAQSHSNLGFTHRSLQQPSLAAEAFRRAVDLFRKVGDHAEEGNAQGNLGLALSDQGLYELAIEHFEEAERIHRSLSDLGVVAYSLSNSALAHFNQIGRASCRERMYIQV